MRTIVTITGIRPDFIRMSEIFRKLDKNFNHILIHTGQHYDKNLSEVFFRELEIREPDYILETGKKSNNHYEQLSYLSVEIPRLFDEKKIKPDLILFLGDANTSALALPLKKEGYKIGHIEGGMRSGDKRMLEEINRTVCDHCSDIFFVYTDGYKQNLRLENLKENIYVVGNTIVEPFQRLKHLIIDSKKRKDIILMDIHRPENFNYKERLEKIIEFGNICTDKYKLPVKLLYFKRLKDKLDEFGINLNKIELINLMPYVEYMNTVFHSKFLISDSGTAQEEPALLETPVLVPREFTERPLSYENNCSFKLELGTYERSFNYIDNIENGKIKMSIDWLLPEGNLKTSEIIIESIQQFLN